MQTAFRKARGWIVRKGKRSSYVQSSYVSVYIYAVDVQELEVAPSKETIAVYLYMFLLDATAYCHFASFRTQSSYIYMHIHEL